MIFYTKNWSSITVGKKLFFKLLLFQGSQILLYGILLNVQKNFIKNSGTNLDVQPVSFSKSVVSLGIHIFRPQQKATYFT